MADALSLLFELTADGRPAVAEFQRVRKVFAGELAALRKTVTQSFTLPPIKIPSTPSSPSAGGRGQVDAHVKEFRRIEAEAAKSAKAQEAEQRRLNRAVEALQRQRSAAIIAGWKAEERAAAASLKGQERAAQQASRSIANAFRGIGPGLQSIGRTLTVGITAPLLALGVASLKSAKDIDANVNTLKAFTGSAEAAEQRLAQLIKTSRQTPGLTTRLATTLDAQLRTAQVTEETIDRVLPAIGRLNAVSKLPDAGRFTQNLLQLVTQNFERQDLKELVGQSPLAGQLLTEIFNVDSPVNAKAIREQAKKLGITSVDAFFNAFAEAAARNQGLATVTESIGTRFDKIVDRVTVALRPLGLAILNAIEPFVEPVAKLIERVGDAFNSLSQPVKTAIIVMAGLAAATGPLLFVLGSIATAIAGVVSAIGTISAAVTAIGLPVIAAALGAIIIVIGRTVAILAVLGLAWKNNFLNIQGLVANAGAAVLEAFSRIKTVIDEATQRLLPTLQSITEKVLGVITVLWERYGATVVRVISATFAITVRTLEAFIRFLGNVVDLVAKLIDGDWRGAWRAFSRIVINALDGLTEFFEKALRILAQGFKTLHAFIIRQAITFVQAGSGLATKLIAALAAGLIAGAPVVADALAQMMLLAAVDFAAGPSGGLIARTIINAMRKAAAESGGISIPVTTEEQGLARIRLNPDGSVKTDKKPLAGDEATRGADAETRRRIRLLELEAERAEAIARQRIAAENIFFEQRKTSLKDFTDFQIKEEEIVLEKKRAVFAAERAEAEKLGKGRDLALGEIRLKELKAEIEFADRKNQLLANQQREELEAAKAHRQAILDIQEQADDAEIARLEDIKRQGGLTFFELEARRAEIEKAARARRRAELELQLREADQNAEDRKKILDELTEFDAESAAATEEAERRKREAIQETADAYRDYAIAIHDALESASEAVRNAAAVALSRLNARVFLSQRERIQRQFVLDRKALEAEKRASDLRIDNAEREAIEKAKKAGDFEEKALQIEKTFNDLRLAEQRRFNQQKKKLEEDKEADLQRADPSSGRSLFGDIFADVSTATGSSLQGLLATGQSVFAQLSEQVGNMRDIMVNAFSAIGQAVGDAVQAFVLYGTAGTSVRKFAAQVIAGVAAMAAVKAVFELAEGFAALARAFFGDPKAGAEAALHFKSAAIYGTVGAIAAVAGRAIAGNSFSNNQGTASAGVSGGQQQQARDREFNYGGNAVEASSSAKREGSANIFTRVIDYIDKRQAQRDAMLTQSMKEVSTALTPFKVASPDDVIMNAKPETIALQNLQAAKENNDIPRQWTEIQGFT